MLSNADLQDYLSLFIVSADESALLTFEGLTPEFWLPGRFLIANDSIENGLVKELDDIFGEQIQFEKILSTTRFLHVTTKTLTHYVLLLKCNTQQKKRVKNSKKYRGKLRWLQVTEFHAKLNASNCKSPELINFCDMYTNTYINKPCMFEGLKSGGFGASNMFEIGLSLLINEKSEFSQLLEAAAINNTNIQQDLYRTFFVICYPAIYMSKEAFVKIYYDNGWTKSDANLLFACADVTNRGGLSFRDFLCILAVTEPCKFNAPASDIRNKYVFKYFDVDNDNHLNADEFKSLLISLQRGKSQTIDEAIIKKEADSILQGLNVSKISYVQFHQLITDKKIKDTYVLLRSGHSFKQIFTRPSLEKLPPQTGDNYKFAANKSQVQKSGVSTSTFPRIESAGKLPPQTRQKPIGFNVALHTVRIERNGAFVDAQNLWSVEHAISDSVIKENMKLANVQAIRTSISTFDKTSICNELLRSLRSLYELNHSTYNLRRYDSYEWGNVDKRAFANNLCEICKMAEKIFATETRLIHVPSPVYVIGDLHGNFSDLLDLENMFWGLGPLLCPANLLFLGDYVDRGMYSVEVTTYLLTYKVLNPSKVFLIRGNHEIRDIQKMFTFPAECASKFGEPLGHQIWNATNKAFDTMPVAAVIDSKIFCCHGGVPPPWLCPIVNAINDVPIVLTDPSTQSPLAWDLMWNDPVRSNLLSSDLRMELSANDGFAYNARRGTAHVFNFEALEKFFAINGFTHMIRAHEVAVAGFIVHQNCKLFTVFSSSQYCGGDNEGACIMIMQGKIRVLRLEHKKNR